MLVMCSKSAFTTRANFTICRIKRFPALSKWPWELGQGAILGRVENTLAEAGRILICFHERPFGGPRLNSYLRLC